MDRATMVSLRKRAMEMETDQRKLGGYDANSEKLGDLFEFVRRILDHLIEPIPEGEYRYEEGLERES